jgi:hypothetical protein
MFEINVLHVLLSSAIMGAAVTMFVYFVIMLQIAIKANDTSEIIFSAIMIFITSGGFIKVGLTIVLQVVREILKVLVSA